MNLTMLIAVLLLVVATGLTWLVRSNIIVLAACVLIAPLPAALVLGFWVEPVESSASGTSMSTITLAIVVCYSIVWLSLIAGWLSSKLARDLAGHR